MKRFLLGISVFLLSFVFVACGATQATVSATIDYNLEKVTSTINTIQKVENSEIAYYDLTEETGDLEQVGLFNGGFNTTYPNVNTYGIPPFANYGMYPVNSVYGANGGYNGLGNNLNYNGYNNVGYNNVGYNNTVFNNGYNNGLFNGGYNNRLFNNGVGALWGSNIDTYRINSVTTDGKNTTYINTYRNVNPIRSSINRTNNTANNTTNTQNVEFVNLSNVCNNCIVSNTYGNSLKAEILENVDYAKQLSASIKSNEITLSTEQINTINDLLDNIARTTSKINMTKGELNSEINSVKVSKTSYQTTPNTVNSKYVKLLSCMDTRNSYLQSILNSLLQLENCVDGTCQSGYCWNGSATNGTCPNCTTTDGVCTNCTDCPDCSSCADCGTCTNCLSCADCTNCTNCVNCGSCENCTDCINCENCTNCSNLANATNCTNNDLSTEENGTNLDTNTGAIIDDTTTPNTNTATDLDKETTTNSDTATDTTNDATLKNETQAVGNHNENINETEEQLNNDDTVRDNFLKRPRPMPAFDGNRPPRNENLPPMNEDRPPINQNMPAFNENFMPRRPMPKNLPAIYDDTENDTNNENNQTTTDENIENQDNQNITDTNSIINENPNENNKSLTA